MTELDPCHTCGSAVKLKRVPVDGAMSTDDPRPSSTDLRVCTNPRCDSNGPDRSIGDNV